MFLGILRYTPNLVTSMSSHLKVLCSFGDIRARTLVSTVARLNEQAVAASTPIAGMIPNTKSFLNLRNERIVMWKLYGNFARHNTHLSLVAVVEDLDFLAKNKDLSYTNKVLYYLQLPHQLKVHISAGQLGFRKSNRQEYEAAYQVSTKMFKTIEERKLINHGEKVELVMKGFGKGRSTFLAALEGKEGTGLRPHIVRITDSTKLRFGGTRPKKLRRLG